MDLTRVICNLKIEDRATINKIIDGLRNRVEKLENSFPSSDFAYDKNQETIYELEELISFFKNAKTQNDLKEAESYVNLHQYMYGGLKRLK